MTTVMSARDRLLEAADELFYAEGVNTVGIDRVIERAGVAKATLYSTFGSKEELVRAYLEQRHARMRDRYATALARHEDPRDKLLAVFDLLAVSFRDPTFRGCAWGNASAEAKPGSAVIEVTDAARSWRLALLTDLATQAGLRDPEGLAAALMLVYDGATVSAKLDRRVEAAAVARAVAESLIDAAS